MPEEAKMKLARRPKKPTWRELYAAGSVVAGSNIQTAKMPDEWLPFVDVASAAYWNTELQD